MRTTVDIPDDLIEQACRASNSRTKRDAILAGLEELIRKAKREGLRRQAGALDLDLDIDLARARHRGRRA